MRKLVLRVSILVFMDLALEVHSLLQLPFRKRVSILVFMDLALEAWQASCPMYQKGRVSILVFMDLALEA